MYITIGPSDVIDVVINGTGVNVSYYAPYAGSPGLAISNATVLAAGTYTLMPSPVSGSNQLFGVTIYNGSLTNTVSLTIRYNNAPSIQPQFVAILAPGYTLVYDGGPGPGSGNGWEIFNTLGTKI